MATTEFEERCRVRRTPSLGVTNSALACLRQEHSSENLSIFGSQTRTLPWTKSFFKGEIRDASIASGDRPPEILTAIKILSDLLRGTVSPFELSELIDLFPCEV